jgi:solute carrier family 25 folate transporter 32
MHEPLEQRKSTFSIELITGTFSGLAACVAFYAFESTEARMQVFRGASKEGIVTRPTMGGTFRHVIQHEGMSGLYRGLLPTALGAGVNWGLYFSIYHVCRTWLAGFKHPDIPQETVPNLGHDLLSASISGVVCTFVVNPFWVLKLRMITAPSPSSASMIGELRSILRNEGPKALWKGLAPSLVGVSEGALQFMAYDQMKYYAQKRGKYGAIEQFFAGGLSKAVSVLVTYPYQLIRSALQQNNSPYKGMLDAAKAVYSNEGLRGLYKGMGVNLLRQVPPSAVMFIIVEQLRVRILALTRDR